MADKNINVSVTDKTFTSEMGGHSTPISQIGESSATESVELDTIQVTPILTRYENRKSDTDEMLTRLYSMMFSMNNKFDDCLLYTSRCV